MLEAKEASLEDVHLLVMDESHHVRGEEPYMQIMRHYQAIQDTDKRPRVLGLTASPACEDTTVQTQEAFSRLEATMSAHIVQVEVESANLEEYTNLPQRQEVGVIKRKEDVQICRLLEEFMSDVEEQGETQTPIRHEAKAYWQSLKQATEGSSRRMPAYGKLCDEAHKRFSQAPGTGNMICASWMILLARCSRALRLVDHGGWELALGSVSRQCLATLGCFYSKDDDLGLSQGAATDLTNLLHGLITVADEWQTDGRPIHPKREGLVKCLEAEASTTDGEPEAGFRGLVFVETREACQQLAAFLCCELLADTVRAGFCVGHGSSRLNPE